MPLFGGSRRGWSSGPGGASSVAAPAHRLKNSAGMIGATGLAVAADQLNGHRGTDPAEAKPYDSVAIQALFAHWDLTRAAITDELAVTPQRSA